MFGAKLAAFNDQFNKWSRIVANTPSARKRARQAEINRKRNASDRSRLRTYMKKVVYAARQGEAETAQARLKEAIPVIDKMAGKGIIHRNTAARYKSRLNARVKALVNAA